MTTDETLTKENAMNAEEFARLLDGREVGHEITETEADLAKASNLLVVFGYRDANRKWGVIAKIRGFAEDEIGCYDGGEFTVDSVGVRPVWPDDDDPFTEEMARFYFARANSPSITITSVWHEDGDVWWTYETTARNYESFSVMGDGNTFCEGLVIDCNELLPGKETR